MDTPKDSALVVLVSFFCGAALVLLLLISFNNTYRDGQIDCINGDVKYELQQQDDNTMSWEWVDDE